MRTRPALLFVEALALVLVLLVSEAVAPVFNATRGTVAWAATQPLLVTAALVVTLIWCALVPDRSERRWTRWA